MNSDLELLPRADLPVIWDAFKAQVEEFRQTAETLTVTDASQKDKMELACRTRLTLRKIRIAVEHKRVELGEGHLKEIQKVNGAAKAIREFIEPMEARLLLQETFAEQVEANRIAALTKSRNIELESIRLGTSASNTGNLSQADYDVYITRLRAEKSELEAANRLRVEAEKRLEEQRLEYRRQTFEAQTKAAAEQAKKFAEAEQARFEQEKKHRDEMLAALALRNIERVDAEKRRQADLQIEREKVAEQKRVQDELAATQRAAQAELDRIRDEKLAKLEAEVAAERAAKQAEADAARKLALAPDVEKLRAYRQSVKDLPVPSGLAPAAESCFTEAVFALAQGLRILDQFCEKNSI